MSRWSRKTDEEKQKIHEKQVIAKQEKQHDDNAIERGQKRAVEIYDNEEIPIYCLEHGWVASEKYRLYIGKDRFTNQDRQYLEGKCKECHKTIQRVISPSVLTPTEMMMFGMVSRLLMLQGRLIDERPKK